jgi:predicted neutral ceramidase superfamily lipid hydrolase
MVCSINNARCIRTFSLPPFFTIHPFTVPCSWYIYVSCYCWWVIRFQFPLTYLFLSCDLRPPLPMCHPRIRVLFSLYTTIVLVQCTSIVIIILYLHLSFSSCLVWRPSFVSRRSFCRSSSHSVLFFSLVVFYVVVRRIFFWCAPKFYCCIFILLSRANNSHLSTAPISNCLL